jgi:NADPH-dependent 2,4-dienoyl-CoA reductase/sulfur reductase-like enzyme
MISTILIIGGGQAGAQAIDTLRREGFEGRIVLVSEERELPYQRPPLSKKFWPASSRPTGCRSGISRSRRAPHRELKLGTRAIRLEPAARRVALSNGRSRV